jgi:hypothetical protein
MAQGIPQPELPETAGPEPAVDCGDPCVSCRGRGRKLVVMRRAEAAPAAAETALLGRTEEPCLACKGTGRATE